MNKQQKHSQFISWSVLAGCGQKQEFQLHSSSPSSAKAETTTAVLLQQLFQRQPLQQLLQQKQKCRLELKNSAFKAMLRVAGGRNNDCVLRVKMMPY